MSVESEILRIQHNIANAYAAVSDKGGEVPLLPDSDNLAAAIRGIPCSSQDIYSLEEQVVGRWIDGRPIYRRIYITRLASGSGSAERTTVLESGITESIDSVINFRGIARYVDSTYIALPSPIDDSYLLQNLIDPGNKIQIYHNSAFFDNAKVLLFLEFTKATDQPTIELPAELTEFLSQPAYKTAPQSAASAELTAGIKTEEV